jgi:hypothetical protein
MSLSLRTPACRAFLPSQLVPVSLQSAQKRPMGSHNLYQYLLISNLQKGTHGPPQLDGCRPSIDVQKTLQLVPVSPQSG